MNGIEPPSPMLTTGLPKCVREAASIACSSQGAKAGAFQPVEPAAEKRTRAPCGGSDSRISSTRAAAASPSTVGGRRSERRAVVWGRSTLPPLWSDGTPSMPITSSHGRHVRFSTSVAGS
jgi:hypothetical protein